MTTIVFVQNRFVVFGVGGGGGMGGHEFMSGGCLLTVNRGIRSARAYLALSVQLLQRVYRNLSAL